MLLAPVTAVAMTAPALAAPPLDQQKPVPTQQAENETVVSVLCTEGSDRCGMHAAARRTLNASPEWVVSAATLDRFEADRILTFPDEMTPEPPADMKRVEDQLTAISADLAECGPGCVANIQVHVPSVPEQEMTRMRSGDVLCELTGTAEPTADRQVLGSGEAGRLLGECVADFLAQRSGDRPMSFVTVIPDSDDGLPETRVRFDDSVLASSSVDVLVQQSGPRCSESYGSWGDRAEYELYIVRCLADSPSNEFEPDPNVTTVTP